MRRFPGRFSVVATVDAHRPDAPERLEEWATQGAKGVRLNPRDPLAIWHKAAELRLMVSLRRRVEDTASGDFRGTVESLPDLNIVIDHLGCTREDTPPPHMMYRRVLALAQYHNTFMKVPGLGEICQWWLKKIRTRRLRARWPTDEQPDGEIDRPWGHMSVSVTCC
jgi:predicted TIM-barrel fold metal-dependent hydrolase